MTITSIRIATAEDAQLIADVINAHELSVDSANSSMSAEGALEFMSGYVDQSKTYLLSIDEETGVSVAINLHPDQARKKFFADVYAMPNVMNLSEVTSWVVRQAESEHPDWEICPGVNSLDERLQSAWSSEGFEFLRRYHTMRVQLNKAPEALQCPGVEIRPINLSDQALVTKWYESHQDSFANHFGFVPRTLENWRELTLGGNLIDSEGVFLAFKDGEAVGYCQCTDEYAHDAKGFISLLGVNHQRQGIGIGEALLRAGLAHSFAKGYKVVELNVDTGNESGALRLYEKIGFKAESSWIQMQRPKS